MTAVRYKMVGRDINSPFPQYRTWVVDGYPDFTGSLYGDGYLRSGDTPFDEIKAYLLYSNQIVDFNLPDGSSWRSTDRTLPENMYDSQLAIIGEDIYLFGGNLTDRILKANINTPSEWKDTGHKLPGPLYASQLAIIDGYVYLFGGCNGGPQDATDFIWRAPISNPLAWEDTGATLPDKLYGSQLALADGYLYLCGGHHINELRDVIYRASVSDPLTWTDDGYTLYEPIYGSQLAIYDGYVYLIGGMVYDSGNMIPTNKIYKAPLTNMNNWSISSFLPTPVAFGQIAFIGNYLFYFGGYGSGKVILQAKLTDPIFSFTDTFKQLPVTCIQSQLAVIYDRIFLFGGNGSTVIQVCENKLKYKLTDYQTTAYAYSTRIIPAGVSNILDMFKAIGYAPWRTDYGSL
jgi:N-acetylneuraminic acid mutarotase